ncbi:MAG: helix-turn-helix transcriptional regulator [Paenibacillaceae bacterium]|nr:helix-turn-helix transcriptional regulator [Paenibacillaceae bacterium]
MVNERPHRTWNDLKSKLTSHSQVEGEVIAQLAQLVNEIMRRRKSLGLTQNDVATRAGITQAQVARLENSHTVPSMETVIKVANVLGLKLGFEEAAATSKVHSVV